MNHSAVSYRARRCRCRTCTDDHRRRHNAEIAARRGECVMVNGRRISTNPRARHGTANTYGYYGCQCEPCTLANTEKSKQYRLSKGI